MNVVYTIAIQTFMYMILAIAVNLLQGYTGLLSVCTAALFGIGGYITGLLLIGWDCDILIAMVIAAAGTMLVGTLVALPSLRLQGDYFYITTLGFQWIVYNIMMNWMEVTNGPLGLNGVPKAHVFGLKLTPRWVLLIFVIIIALITIYFANRVCSSPFGRALKGVREDQIAVEALGKSVTKFKVSVFAFAAILCSIAGTIYAANMQALDPTAFTMDESIFIMSMIVLGGMGTMKGNIVGAIILNVMAEGIRYVGLPTEIAFNVRQIIYGVILLVCMMFRPQGLFGEYSVEDVTEE